MTGTRPAVAYSVGVDDLIGIATGGTWPSVPTAATRLQALAVPAVLRGRNLIAGTIASLPLRTLDRLNNPVDVALLRQIDPDVPNSVTLAMTVEDLLFEGISWWQTLARDYYGFPASARHLDADKVFTQIPPGFPLSSLPSDYMPGSHVFVGSYAVPARNIIRFDSPNPPLLVAAGGAIRRALKLEQAADRYADDPAAREFFTPVDGVDPDDDEVTAMLDAWLAARQLRAAAYVPAGFERHEAQSLSPVDLQLSQLQDKATLALANAMGLDPEDLGVSTTSRTYQNAVDRRQDRVNECYGPYIQALEDRLSMGDITRRGQRACFDLDDFLKAAPLERAQTQQVYHEIGALSVPEIRAAEYLPVTDPSADYPATPPRQQIAATGSPAAPVADAATGAAGLSLVMHGDDPAGLIFDADDLAAGFAVNEERRTITGIVVPWGKIGRAGGRKWRFDPGSLKFSAARVNRIKLLNDHDSSLAVGRVERTWTDGAGQWATFKVARGHDGDQALALAHDGVKDGLSVGVGWEGDASTFAHHPDPADGSVQVVTSAPWRETSLVALPAFDDARATAVTMAAANGRTDAMPCGTCGQIHAEGTACPTAPAPAPVPAAPAAQFDAAAMQTAVAAAVAAAFTQHGGQAPAPAAPGAVPAPDPVNPVRPVPGTVREAPLYRFDGGKAQRVFSADLAAAARGDTEAREILDRYMATDMAAQFTNVAPTDVDELNPVPTRPELYVPKLDFPRPLGRMVTLGPLNDLIAFFIPQFSSASGLVANHTPGTEPSSGTFVTTKATVTPVGLSGRVDVDREIIDSGGSPQADQLIYAEMVRAYNEKLETRIVDMLQALSLSDTDIVGVDNVLQSALIETLAGLQFVRGGDRYSSLALDSTLYNAITGAVDGEHRPLFPMVGATNTDGTVSADLSSVRIGSKTGVPAWALETANGGPAKSFLFCPGSVYQWASAPRRFDFTQVNVSSVAIAIWGYSAEAMTRTGDVLQLAYAVS
jgi:phage head maturation protease